MRLTRVRLTRAVPAVLLLALLALLATCATPVGAGGGGDGDDRQLEPEDLGVEIELAVGLGGQVSSLTAAPVRITLRATELVSGTLTVRNQFQDFLAESVAVEVAPGATETHWVLLPSSEQQLDLLVTLRTDGGTAVVRQVAGGADSVVIGLLPSLASGGQPPAFRVRGLESPVTYWTFDPDVADLGPLGLGPLDLLAGRAADLDALSPTSRAAITGWIGRGGELLLDDAPGPVAALPSSWHPTSGRVVAGRGTVRAVDGALARGRWAEVVDPPASRSPSEEGAVNQVVPYGSVGNDLQRDLGREVPSLGGLLAVVGIYVLLAGPVAYFVLRRRTSLRWLAIPALAVLTTALVLASGSSLRPGRLAAQISVIDMTAGGAIASTAVAFAGQAGADRIELPPGWTAGSGNDIFPAEPVVQRRTADGTTLTTDIAEGGYAVATLTGPVDLDGSLEVDARSADDGIVTGTVTNRLDVTLRQVAVMYGSAAGELVGDLAPGASADFELTDTNVLRVGRDVASLLWGSSDGGFVDFGKAVAPAPLAPRPGVAAPAAGAGPPTTVVVPEPGAEPAVTVDGSAGAVGEDDIVSRTCEGDSCVECDAGGRCDIVGAPGQAGLARSQAFNGLVQSQGVNFRGTGTVLVAGWTDELEPALRLPDRTQLRSSRSAVVARAPVQPVDRLTDATARRVLVSGDLSGAGGVEANTALFRYELPSGAEGRSLQLRVPSFFGRTEVLTGTTWTAVPGEVGVGVDVPLPAGALAGRTVLVRAALPPDPPAVERDLAIREAG